MTGASAARNTPRTGASVHTFEPNERMSSARNRKAVAMAAAAWAGRITPEDIEDHFDDDDWKTLAQIAMVNPPNSQATKNLVVEHLRTHARIHSEVVSQYGENPLAGLPKS